MIRPAWSAGALHPRPWGALVVAVLLLGVGNSSRARPDGARFYRVAQQDGVWWLIAPDGQRFFSLGVDVIDQGARRESYRADRPEYAAFLHYPTAAAWADATIARLRKWNFNTIGPWSDLAALARARPPALPYTVGLWVGSESGVPWLDLFSEATERRFDESARRQVLPLRDDPALIGYFTDNELGWWDETIFRYHLQQPPNATRNRLLELLREHYAGDFARLRRDFDPGPAQGFADLEKPVELGYRPGGQGRKVIEAFTTALARRYYALSHAVIRRYDLNHLILGDRYISWYPPAVARAAAPFVDVISTNYNADWLDGGVARFHFDTLHRLTGRPVLVTEYYFAGMQNRSGNRNSGAGFPTVPTQAARAAGFRGSLSAFAALPYVVGAHWFQYYDEPTHGRADGEDFNMGLVDIGDQPYEELTTAATRLQAQIPALHARALPEAAASATSAVPPAPADPAAGLRGWNRARAILPAASRFPAADLFASWERRSLYLAVHAGDYVDAQLYPDGTIAPSDRLTCLIRLEGARRPITVAFGPGGAATLTGPAALRGDWARGPRFTALVAVPAAAVNRRSFRAGDSLRLDATLTLHGGLGQTRWSRRLRLAPGPEGRGRGSSGHD